MKVRRVYPSAPLVGAGAVVYRGKKVLLLRRRFPPNEGKWALPGGLVELGEGVEQAVLREVEEETGLRVKLERLLGVSTDIHLDGASRPRYHYILVDYVARALGTRIEPNGESSDSGWFSRAEVKKLSMTKGTRKALERFFSGPRTAPWAR
ncbi:MAG: NUDIX hydrolase [archaeon]|nr:MAG: NUDIX hydrolase [archaeon]